MSHCDHETALKRRRAWRTCLGLVGKLELQRDVFEYLQTQFDLHLANLGSAGALSRILS
ncbi:hypothetical protein R3P38DRAFT_3360486 [Favolaschia claudopus]|uniref:Uncharacterized protein n=1 Tax=Favolaschia claudopus TaxID=2862362 RepID=A0AAW0AX50_9AGAR